MTAEELNTLHEEYRRAVEATRAPESDEAAQKAADDMIDLRRKLDAALIEDKAEREDERRAEAVEARAAAARFQAQAAPAPKSSIPLDDIRAYASEKRQQLSFTVPMETRTDITNEVATTYAGYTVPQTWADKVYMFQLAQSGVLKAGPTILRTPTGNLINFPTLVTDVVSTHHNEGDASSAVYPVFGTVQLNQYRVDHHMPISDELLRDSGVALESVLAEISGRSLGAKVASYLGDEDVGTGSDLPNSLTISSTAGVTAASQTVVTLDEIIELFYSVLPQYRANGSFIANSAVTLGMAKAKDANGNYIWQPSVMAGEPDRVFGKPWYEDAYFDASAASGKVVTFGDVGAAFIVRYSGGLEISFSRDFAFTSFETTMRAGLWIDSHTIDAIACKHIVLGT